MYLCLNKRANKVGCTTDSSWCCLCIMNRFLFRSTSSHDLFSFNLLYVFFYLHDNTKKGSRFQLSTLRDNIVSTRFLLNMLERNRKLIICLHCLNSKGRFEILNLLAIIECFHFRRKTMRKQSSQIDYIRKSKHMCELFGIRQTIVQFIFK